MMNMIKKDNGFDIFILLKLIWDEKKIFIFFSVIPIILSIFLWKNTETTYSHSITYVNDIHKFEQNLWKNNCDQRCKNKIYTNSLLMNYQHSIDFEVNDTSITYFSDQVSYLDQVYDELIRANKELTENFQTEFMSENYIIETNYKEVVKNIPGIIRLEYELITYNQLMHNKLMLDKIEKGHLVFLLSKPKLTTYNKKPISLILFLILFLPLFSIFIIYVKRNFKNLFSTN